MAIQVPTGQRVAPGQLTGQSRTSDGSRGAVEAGNQMQRQGAALDQAGQLMQKIRLEQIEQVNETKINAALAEAQAATVTFQRDYSQLQGANAMPDALDGQTLTQKFTGEFDRNLPEIALAHNLNDVQRERFNARVQPLRSAFFEASSKYEAAQFDSYSKQTYETAVASSSQNLVANWNDPTMAAVAIDNMAAATANESRRLGLSEEAARLAFNTNVGNAVTTVVDNNVATNPLGMRDFVDKYRDSISPSQAAALDNKVGAQLADIEGRTAAADIISGLSRSPGEVGSGSSEPLPGVGVPNVMPIDGASVPTGSGKGFGPRDPVRTTNGNWSSSDHDGADFPAPAGTPVRAVAAGRVVRAGVNGNYGNWVEIEHADGSRTGYAHLQGFNVKVDDELAPGQTLGSVGSTGNSTGPHLHLRYRDAQGRAADPALLFQNGGATGNAPAATAGASGVTRAQAIREVNARYGNNPRMRAAAMAAVNEHFTEEDRAQREAEENQLNAAYAFIRDNKQMPPASMLVGLERQLGSLQGYFNNVTADPTRDDDPEVALALAGNPDLWKNMTPTEFEASYGAKLSRGTLMSYVRTLGNLREAAAGDAAKAKLSAAELDMVVFNRVFASYANLSGANDLPDDDTTKQQTELLRVRAQDYVLARQRASGQPLSESEMRGEVSNVFAALAWEQPRRFRGPDRSFAVSYSQMSEPARDRARASLREKGNRNPSQEQIFAEYLAERLPIR